MFKGNNNNIRTTVLLKYQKKTLDFTSFFTSISKVLICCHFEQVNKCLLKGQGPLTSFWCFYG